MRGALPVVVLLAACEPPGLTLEIRTTNTAVKSVEVLVGMNCEGDCPRGITPPALSPRPVDHIFVFEDGTPWVAEVEGGTAGFRLASDSATEVDLLLAIGLAGDGTPLETAYAYDVEVPVSRGEHVRVTLEPAMPVAASLTDPPPPEGTEGLAIWREPVAKRACVLAEHWSSDPEPRRDLIVPTNDTDCDEIPPSQECAPWTPLAMNAPSTISTANCAFLSTLAVSTDVCLLGGALCNELAPTPTSACTHLDAKYCAPKTLCTSCSGADWSPDCASDALISGAMQSALPYLDCSFRVDEAGMPCMDEVIVTDVNLSALLGVNRVASCHSIGLHDLTAPFGPFDYKVQTPSGLLKVDNLSQPCTVDVHWKGTALTPGMVMPPTAVFVDLGLDNTNHLVLPAVIGVEGGCGTPARCALVTSNLSDTMLECTKQRGTMTAICGASGQCAEGPECGSGCCGRGEECVDGTCKCGGNAGCDGGDVCTIGAPNYDQCGSICCGVSQLCPF